MDDVYLLSHDSCHDFFNTYDLEETKMTGTPIFKGAASALITPLNENGVDYQTLDKLIDWQIAEGINALVIAGTTGEDLP